MLKNKNDSMLILIADDDADDRMFLEQALRQTGYSDQISTVEDGEELLNYLQHTGPYTKANSPRPTLLILDLNMPRMNGFQALKIIKDDVALRRLPVVVMSTSTADEDILRSYDLGVNSFVIKPFHYNRLVEVISALKTYWLETVRLPE
jgi:CheY-like chemotaxis protein